MSKKINKFVLLTYLITWTAWGVLGLLLHYTDMQFAQTSSMILFVFGGLGPTITAFLVINPRISRDEFRTYVSRIFRVKVNPAWYLFMFATLFILFSIPFIKNYIVNGSGAPFLNKPIYMLLVFMISNILFGGLEELGWRGILLPELLKKHSGTFSTLATSVIWTFWHIPLFLIKGSPQQGSNFIHFFILGLCFSLILSVIYIYTESIFLCVITHSLINSIPNIINMPFNNVYFELLMMLAFCVIIFAIFMRKDVNQGQSKDVSN